MRSDFIDRYLVVGAAKRQRPPERYSLGFSVLVILAVTLLGWVAIGYATLLQIQQIKSFSF
jgi:hypothetical protein